MAGTKLRDLADDKIEVFEKCILFLHEIMNNGARVLFDDEGRIVQEYEFAYKINSYPNNATEFFAYSLEHAELVHISETEENVYNEYPDDPVLRAFDPPDRKFIAVSYAYEDNAPIIEATDSKWWGIVKNLKENGITVQFIDEEYIKKKYIKKMGMLIVK